MNTSNQPIVAVKFEVVKFYVIRWNNDTILESLLYWRNILGIWIMLSLECNCSIY